MNFNFNVEEILPNRVTIVESKNSNPLLSLCSVQFSDDTNAFEVKEIWNCNFGSNVNLWSTNLRQKKENLESIIDKMGYASAKAQDLLSPITSFQKLLNSNQQKLYIIRDEEPPHFVIGILKTGLKRLFICDEDGTHHEVNAICVLDFYVHESKQRCGFGYELFNVMLKVESIEPSNLAIDRPSFKLLQFLKKYYGLANPRPQANNFVVFSDFFTNIINPHQSGNLDLSDCSKNGNTVKEKFISKDDSKVNESNNSTIFEEKSIGIDHYFRKRRSSNILQNAKPRDNYNNRGESKGGVYDALHGHFDDDGYLQRFSPHCSSTSAKRENGCSQRKWEPLQSSWNVLGVKPLDYSNAKN